MNSKQLARDGSKEPSERTRRKRHERHRRVLSSAFDLLEERGLDAFTLGDLAEELDYSPAALYRYFASKDALVAELQRLVVVALDRDLGRVVTRCQEWADDDAGRAELRELLALVAVGAYYDRFAAEAPELFGVISQGLGHPGRLIGDDELAGGVIAAAGASFTRIAGLAENAAAADVLTPGDPMQRAVTMWASLQGIVQMRKLAHLLPETLQPEPLLDSLLHALLEGWGADPDRLAEALQVVSAHDLVSVAIDPMSEATAPAP